MKTTQQFSEQIFTKYGFKLISEYTGAHSKVTFQCEQGHNNSATATNLLQRGYKCKECIAGRPIVSKITWNKQQLQELYDNDHSTEEIAQLLKTTKAAVDNACQELNISRSKTIATTKRLKKILLEQNRQLLTDQILGAENYALIKCSNNHIVNQLIGNIIYKQTNCPDCFRTQPSTEQLELLDFITSNYTGWIELGDRKILAGKELDIVLPDLGLAIEYNGTYWHGDHKVDKNYHLNKTNQVEEFGYQLIHINSYTWQHYKPIVKNKLLNLIISQPRLAARKTSVQPVSWLHAKEFLNNYHIQQAGAPTAYNYGLYYDGELVALATFAKPRYASDYDIELVRYATSRPVQGGLGKLLKYSYKQLNWQSIITYALRDWSTGQLYNTLGFEYLGNTGPNYAYYNKTDKISRYKAQNYYKLLPSYDPKLTEYENMLAAGWWRVWDSGSQIWAIRLHH